MPMIPNAGKYAPPVSQYIPLLSRIPANTLSRRLGVQPSWPKTDAISRRVGRAPVEVGFSQFLIWLLTLPVTWPVMPLKTVALVAQTLERQANKEQNSGQRLKDERLSLEMTREMEGVSGHWISDIEQ